ncbi:MAG: hypothetical protein AB1646_05880 [Thermodesulfobacteriota bacterium]
MTVVRYRTWHLASALLLAAFTWGNSAYAWEFSMSGKGYFTYEYRSHLGSKGFFGPAGEDASLGTPSERPPAGSYASANSWLGYESLAGPRTPLVGDIVTGSDASRSLFGAYFLPKVQINQALSVTGRMRVGPGQLLDETPGVDNEFADLEWTLFWVTCRTPWGSVQWGKKPLAMGCGLQFDGGNRTDDRLTIVCPYGPLKAGIGVYPWRRGSRRYGNPSDRNAATEVDVLGFVEVDTGTMSGGLGGTFVKFHEGPEAAFSPDERNGTPTRDVATTEGWIFFKFNDGRFFCNTEADWYYRIDRFQRSANGTLRGVPDTTDGSGSLFRPRHLESWRYVVEIGAISGPAKLSLLYACLPGPDRRHGVLIDRQPYVQGPEVANTNLFRPYSEILNTRYGSGAGAGLAAAPDGRDCVSYNGEGYMSDAAVYALRCDYALAANLNLFGSCLYADRTSHGYGWGFIAPTYVSLTAPVKVRARFSRKGSFAAPAPAIPDKSLGWEFGAGLSWQLLDSWTLGFRSSYWQPGKWFNFACIDRTVSNWDGNGGTILLSSANNWGTNPNRQIDSVVATTCTLSLDF